jgi:hypothetical protein
MQFVKLFCVNDDNKVHHRNFQVMKCLIYYAPTNTKRAPQKTQKINSNKSTRRLITKPKQMTLRKRKHLITL